MSGQSCPEVVQKNAPTAGQPLNLPKGRRLSNVQNPEKKESNEVTARADWKKCRGCHHAGYLIDHDRAGIRILHRPGGGARAPESQDNGDPASDDLMTRIAA